MFTQTTTFHDQPGAICVVWSETALHLGTTVPCDPVSWWGSGPNIVEFTSGKSRNGKTDRAPRVHLPSMASSCCSRLCTAWVSSRSFCTRLMFCMLWRRTSSRPHCLRALARAVPRVPRKEETTTREGSFGFPISTRSLVSNIDDTGSSSSTSPG